MPLDPAADSSLPSSHHPVTMNTKNNRWADFSMRPPRYLRSTVRAELIPREPDDGLLTQRKPTQPSSPDAVHQPLISRPKFPRRLASRNTASNLCVGMWSNLGYSPTPSRIWHSIRDPDRSRRPHAPPASLTGQTCGLPNQPPVNDTLQFNRTLPDSALSLTAS